MKAAALAIAIVLLLGAVIAVIVAVNNQSDTKAAGRDNDERYGPGPAGGYEWVIKSIHDRNAAEYGDTLATDQTIVYVGVGLGAAAVLGLIIWLVVVGVKSSSTPTAPIFLTSTEPTGGAPALTSADGPGSYRVVGVDKESGFDTELVIEAQTAANAKAKGELKGIVVTEVVRVADDRSAGERVVPQAIPVAEKSIEPRANPAPPPVPYDTPPNPVGEQPAPPKSPAVGAKAVAIVVSAVCALVVAALFAHHAAVQMNTAGQQNSAVPPSSPSSLPTNAQILGRAEDTALLNMLAPHKAADGTMQGVFQPSHPGEQGPQGGINLGTEAGPSRRSFTVPERRTIAEKAPEPASQPPGPQP